MIGNNSSLSIRQIAEMRAAYDRESTASRVAAAIRDQIVEGVIRPGSQLVEEHMCTALRVSRSTLREAFAQLQRERLVIHELNRGVFVRELTGADIVDIYRTRRLIECAAIRDAQEVPVVVLRDMRSAVEDGRIAAREQRWRAVAAASIRFHQALVGLSHSERVDEIMRQVMAEFRLAYAVMDDPRMYHEPYLARHPAILEALGHGDLMRAETLLRRYLDDAEAQILRAFGPPRYL
jgi:DNA-binding GntR family transcriptional regulator